MKKRKIKRSGFSFTGALLFFVCIAFIIQVAILMFQFISTRTSDKVLIAVLILVVIFVLSAICTVIDIVRRKIMVDKPLNLILDATEKIASGDFSVRLDIAHPYGKYNEYDYIMENLNVMTAELSKSEVLKTDFISSVSHEIKTPLAIIQNYVGVLQDASLDEQTRSKYVKVLLQATRRLSDLITNILKLNKLENQQIKSESKKFNLTEAVSQTVIDFEELIEQKNISLDCDFDDIKIVSDQTLLETVWYNLLSNAVKFTSNGGKISLELKKDKDKAIFSVKDNGCGMTKETGARIFDKFYQGDTSRSQEGNGLGLSLVKKVIDFLGGEISVVSEVGVGSMFTVVLSGVTDER